MELILVDEKGAYYGSYLCHFTSLPIQGIRTARENCTVVLASTKQSDIQECFNAVPDMTLFLFLLVKALVTGAT